MDGKTHWGQSAGASLCHLQLLKTPGCPWGSLGIPLLCCRPNVMTQGPWQTPTCISDQWSRESDLSNLSPNQISPEMSPLKVGTRWMRHHGSHPRWQAWAFAWSSCQLCVPGFSGATAIYPTSVSHGSRTPPSCTGTKAQQQDLQHQVLASIWRQAHNFPNLEAMSVSSLSRRTER